MRPRLRCPTADSNGLGRVVYVVHADTQRGLKHGTGRARLPFQPVAFRATWAGPNALGQRLWSRFLFVSFERRIARKAWDTDACKIRTIRLLGSWRISVRPDSYGGDQLS